MALRLPSLLVFLAVTAAASAQPVDRALLEGRVDHAVDNRLAASDEELSRQRSRAVEAESGLRLYGAAGANQVRDVVSSELVRSYPAMSAQVGLRWPILGSRDNEVRQKESAQVTLEESGMRRAATRSDALRALRLAYAEASRRREQVALADALLAQEEEAGRILERRWRQRLLLESDYREFLSIFSQARRDRAIFMAEHDRALRQLAALSGLEVDGELPPAAFRTACLDRDSLLAGRDRQAALQLAHTRLDGARRLLSVAGSKVPEAGLILSQGVVQELGGHTGGTTYLGLDFRLPLGWRAAADARRAEALAQVEHGELAVEAGERQFDETVQLAMDSLTARAAGLGFAADRVAAARAQVRITRQRLQLADGDVVEKLLQALQALYRTASDQVEAVLAYEKAQAEVLALASECPTDGGKPAALAGPEGVAGELLKPLGVSAVPVREASVGKVGWYAWAGTRWLRQAGNPAWMSRLARHASRIMLSFKAEEIATLADNGKLADELRRFIAAARAEGIAVDLLLGDPGWLQPGGRGALTGHIAALAGFPFDQLHLDLERSQLPREEQGEYPGWLVDTVRAASRASPWPVALSVHYREAGSAALVADLQAAGLRELCLMAYLANPRRVEEIVAPVLARHPDLAIAVALSIEPRLPAEESLARRGVRGIFVDVDGLDRSLRRFPNFAGLRVQSLEDFIRLSP